MKKFHLIICLLVLLVVAIPVYAQQKVWDFEDEKMISIPVGWKVGATQLRGKIAGWNVVVDFKDGKKTKVLGMTAVNDDFNGTFNLCWADSIQFKDGEISVDFKAIGGVVDQGGGPIWRVVDENNYYIARANPLENNFRLYYVKNGIRTTLDSVKVSILSDEWHHIKIVHRGSKIEGYLNGQKLLKAEDNTFSEVGGVGLWTKADAVTYFDNVSVVTK